MKTSKEMVQEYIDEYSKVQKSKDEYLFENYVGNNGNKIKAKKRKYLKYSQNIFKEKINHKSF